MSLHWVHRDPDGGGMMVLPIQDGSATVKVELRIYVNKVMG